MQTNFLVFGSDQVVDNVRTRCVSSTVAKPFLATWEITPNNRGRVVNPTVTSKTEVSMWAKLKNEK